MMTLNIVLVGLSFLLDGKMSMVTNSLGPSTSIFITIYSIVALVIIYPSFSEEKKYFYIAGILGLMFDITYTSTFILNLTLFLMIAFIIKAAYFFLNNSFINTIFISIIAITLYYCLSYSILFLIGYHLPKVNALLKIILSSLIVTSLFSGILFIINKNIIRKFNLKPIK